MVLWDFGEKENIRRELLKRGCEVIRVPYDTTAEQILQMDPDGIMLSNGPGDPAENTEIIDQLKILCKSGKPIFGICLGHQLMALAQGGKTEKLKYGHRGANQPAEDLVTGRVYITSQNHGYAVVADSLPENAKCALSMPMTAPVKAWIIWMLRFLQSSSIRKPARDLRIRTFYLIDS